MNGARTRINIYLLALLVGAGLWTGCRTSHARSEKDLTRIRFHLEVNPSQGGRSQTVQIGRDHPFVISVERNPFLTEYHVESASLVEALGGFQIFIQLNSTGRLILEQYSTAAKGQRVAIFADFGQQRWLAAPVMRGRIASGEVVFTPDASREEAERIVTGLNRMVELIRKGRK